MGWTNKVANVIKGRIGNMVAGAITNKLMSSFAAAGQTKKVAAKLLSKSPLEIGNMSPTAHMAENPYSYGTECYPQETANLGDGHYVTDLHATVLHLLGLDNRKLEVPGRKRLDIDHGKPIREILA